MFFYYSLNLIISFFFINKPAAETDVIFRYDKPETINKIILNYINFFKRVLDGLTKTRARVYFILKG